MTVVGIIMISLSKRGAHFSVSERGQVASPREVAGLAESNRLAESCLAWLKAIV